MTAYRELKVHRSDDFFASLLASDPAALVVGSAADILKCVPDGAFACCVTSPPYWGLRDYGIPGQIRRRARTGRVSGESRRRLPSGPADTQGRRHTVAQHRGFVHKREPQVARQGQQEPHAGHDVPAAHSERPEAEGPDRHSLATRVRIAGRRLVSPVGNHMAQAKLPA